MPIKPQKFTQVTTGKATKSRTVKSDVRGRRDRGGRGGVELEVTLRSLLVAY